MDMTWFTRFEQDEIDRDYLDNMRAATELFQEWFTIGASFGCGFTPMLINMHKLATRNGYTGFTNSSTRHSPLVPLGSEFRGTNREAWRPLLKKGWFSEVQVDDDGVIRPELSVPELGQCHYLTVREKGYELYLPHEKHVPDFVWNLAQIMDVLRETFCPALVANYIQLFVVGHPFERVNYSICMAQVNCILDHYGFETLRHEWFDFDCFIYDHDRCARMFENRLEKR